MLASYRHALRSKKYMHRTHSLRRRLFNLLGIIFLVTLLLIGAGVYYFIYQNEQIFWQSRQQDAANSAAEIVTSFIQRTEDGVRLVGSIDRADLIKNPQIMWAAIKQNPALLELVRVDSEGNLLPGSYQDAPILANSFTIPQSLWFLEARQGRFYLSGVQISPESEPYLIMAAPASDGGVIAARLQMNLLWDLVSHLDFGETGQSYVVNSRGEIVAHTNPNVALTRTSLQGRPEIMFLERNPNQQWAGTYTNFQGAVVIGVAVPVPGTSWVVFTEVSKSEAFATSRTALFLLAMGLASVGLLVILTTGHFLNTLVLKPIEKLQAGAFYIGRGDFTHHIELKTERQDEITHVAAAFNEMVYHLHERDMQIAHQNQALQESEERFRLVVTSISDHIYMSEINGDGQYINHYISPNVEELTGYPAEQFMIDWSFWPSQVIHPNDRAAAQAQAQKLAQGINCQVEYRLIRADGNIIWVRDSGQVKQLAENHSTLIFGVVSNITERKRAQQALEEQQAFLQQIIDANPHFIFVKNRQGRYTLVNQAFAQAYNLSVEDILGKTDSEINPIKEMAQRFAQDDQIVINSGQDLILPEDEVVNIYGDILWRYTIKRPIFGANGAVKQVLGVATDITYLKHAEAAIARARDRAIEANEFKARLLANVSHDLRTPLGAILGYSEMMKEEMYGPINQKQREIIQKMINSINNLTGMVSQLLDQAKLEANTLSLIEGPFDPRELVESIQATMQILAEAKGLQLCCEVAVDVPVTITGDAERLQQIFNNLVGNAIKFTEAGRVKVNVYRPDEAHWAIAVSDTGPGIPQDAHAYIFEAFRQVDGSATKKHSGSGLGLSIVKQLAELMGGQVQLTSEVGSGSTFTVVLPLIPIKVPAK